jgi:hypothetical protein
MRSKITLLGIVILLVANSGFVFTSEKKPTNLPPGVFPTMWIPLTENSGIALRDQLPMSDLRGNTVTHGTLMVKVGDVWQRMCLESAPEFMPVKP